ncbi:hypothetical protein KV100_19125 [Mumia sp. zg.B21]|uniref:antitoxin VbhA family protein n=1 Tax=Mumia sp. zg.B21 TaxID=2855447 RepID=UPI001C6E7272|nr:hypothetical protein [Mumia sp. zg.B21]MBW9211767.1 hypothetical protein [Mumia sp. zg.B21]
MAEKFDVEERWPELFEQLDSTQRRAVRQSLAAAWHEGWIPNREDVENLTDEARGAIDETEYLRRVREAALRAARAPVTTAPSVSNE